LDGLNKPAQISKRCRAAGLPGSALTDHGTIAGAVSFMDAMKGDDKKGIPDLQSIVGCEMYISPKDATQKDGDRSLSHLVVLAKNHQGWKQLIQATSSSNHPDHFYYKPRLDLERLAQFADGNLIAFSGHMGSHLSECIFTDINAVHACATMDAAKQFTHSDWVQRATTEAMRLRDIFGPENFFIEIQLVDQKNLPAVNLLALGLRYVSEKTGIPCIATPDAHYSSTEDAFDQRVLLCNSLNTNFKEINDKLVRGDDIALGAFFRSRNYHIPTYDELIEAGNTEAELARTLEIAAMCESYKLTGPPMLPQFPCPDGLSSKEYMKKLLDQGWQERMPKIQHIIETTGHTEQEYLDRLDMEFKTLTEIGLADYFLIVNDIISWARNDGQLTGAGRGSAAGALTLYLMGVTHIDPIEFDLLFERFYNAGRNTETRVSLPDVDMDFEIKNRGRVIDYIRDRYGHNRVAQMLTFTRLQGRGALKDVMRAHAAASYEEMNRITAHIPDEAEISDQLQAMKEADKKAGGDGEASIIQWALENNADELKQWAFLDEQGRIQGPMAKIFEQAIRIEGTKKSQSKHAAGIVISQQPLSEVCPMVYDKSSKEMIAGMEMNDLEAMGHTKFDILAVAMLDKCHGVLNLLKYGELHPEKK
jgi:DNA polymerase-3 subunit alpha